MNVIIFSSKWKGSEILEKITTEVTIKKNENLIYSEKSFIENPETEKTIPLIWESVRITIKIKNGAEQMSHTLNR